MFKNQPYGDLTELNRSQGILYHVGKDVLITIAKSYLDLLNTSSAIYEIDGSYATALFTSSYCSFMDGISRGLCGTSDDREALDSGKWLCHESCWTKASRVSIETGKPCDLRPCDGGINIYAIPIKSEGRIIGSINIGYGTPPTDEKDIRELAVKYKIDASELIKHAREYAGPPEFVVEAAKKNLHLAAELIGEIYTRKKNERALEERRRELEKIVEEKSAEIKSTYEKFLHVEKLSSLGKLTGAIAHEFNNPLYGMRNVLESVNDEIKDEQLKKLLALAIKECDRMAALVSKLREFYMPSPGDASTSDFNKLLDDVMMLMRKKLQQKNIKFIGQLSNQPLPFKGITDQIKQVLLNIIQNAEESINHNEGLITMETKATGSSLTLKIKDNGCGIAPENIGHIFDPFYTTKASVKGTGLGLSVCYSIIKKHGGSITVESEKSSGTCFTIQLPLENHS